MLLVLLLDGDLVLVVVNSGSSTSIAFTIIITIAANVTYTV